MKPTERTVVRNSSSKILKELAIYFVLEAIKVPNITPNRSIKNIK